eukprot:CAMPEP_0170780322 /NCGR_PEP_ID=MMETSP0733-20121128/13516_1 /TAXON_ID=186038 /ORGANISM="Fragilariopsis kerguelensis, Strain L26-C5" /LENGTH=136 /DNA_ID=CAMNT_0011124111 /DNA_START=89 /DNA_END=499 /DNA_ORIENTATION=+
MKFSLALITTTVMASASAFTTPSASHTSLRTVLFAEAGAVAVPEYTNKRETEAKERNMEKIGQQNKQWEKYFTLLETYKAEKGDCNVPEEYEENNVGQWLYNQRKAMKQGKMDVDKRQKLEDLGVVWSLRSLMKKE